MKSWITVVGVISLVGLSSCSTGSVHPTASRPGSADRDVSLSAAATSGMEVPPSMASPSAQGAFVGHLKGQVLAWQVTFSNLSGPVTRAHIHLGNAGVAGPMLIPLCEPCTSGQRGTVHVTAKQAQVLLNNATYVNIHTARNPNGEVRGQLSVSPGQ
jgi:hypothetical protein